VEDAFKCNAYVPLAHWEGVAGEEAVAAATVVDGGRVVSNCGLGTGSGGGATCLEGPKSAVAPAAALAATTNGVIDNYNAPLLKSMPPVILLGPILLPLAPPDS
jgi:hypothetical protein